MPGTGPGSGAGAAGVAMRVHAEHAVRLGGVAQAGVVIARQYPFNPVLQVFELGANGPAASGVTNHAFNETTMRLDLELRGQGRIRQAGAAATLTRTEWDIATQEVTTAIAV